MPQTTDNSQEDIAIIIEVHFIQSGFTDPAYYGVHSDEGWKIRDNLIIIGRFPRVEIPLINVAHFRVYPKRH